MKNILLIFVLAFLTTSCFTQKGLARKSDFKPDLFYKDNLSGLYENGVPEDDQNSLWQDLYRNKSHKDIVLNAIDTQVELEFISDKLLKASLYRRGRLEDSIELKGKIRNGYFVINRRVKTFPLPIFYLYAENKTIVGNDESGNLILVQGQRNEYVLFFTLFGGDSDVISARYARL